MSGRMDRIYAFDRTMKICRESDRLKEAIAASIAGQRIYWEEDPMECPPPRFSEPATILLSAKKTVEAARPYAEAGQRVCILNFASSVSPGGGVVDGAQAQEESICRVSSLYPALSHPETAGEFYNRHWALIREGKMNRRNRDDLIYTPGVMAIRDDANDEVPLAEKDWYAMDVITCAAPDLRRSNDSSQYSPTREELLALHETRWRRILTAAAMHQADVLILGAFGCGVFANPPALVVEAFNHVMKDFIRSFAAIEFAVYSTSRNSPNYQAFSRILNIREIG